MAPGLAKLRMASPGRILGSGVQGGLQTCAGELNIGDGALHGFALGVLGFRDRGV